MNGQWTGGGGDILRERASRLARPPRTEDTADRLDLLLARAHGERYAIELRHLARVLERREIAPIPDAEPPVVGLTEWGGGLVLVLNLGLLLGGEPTPTPAESELLVLESEGSFFAVPVEKLEKIVQLRPAEIFPIRPGGARDREHLLGVTANAVMVIDGAALTLNSKARRPA